MSVDKIIQKLFGNINGFGLENNWRSQGVPQIKHDWFWISDRNKQALVTV